MNTMRRMTPWLFWIVLLLALTVAGVRENGTGVGTTNPRSYDHPPPVQSAAQPCQSSAFPSPSLPTPSGQRMAGSH
jgi:hypothetical protein